MPKWTKEQEQARARNSEALLWKTLGVEFKKVARAENAFFKKVAAHEASGAWKLCGFPNFHDHLQYFARDLFPASRYTAWVRARSSTVARPVLEQVGLRAAERLMTRILPTAQPSVATEAVKIARSSGSRAASRYILAHAKAYNKPAPQPAKPTRLGPCTACGLSRTEHKRLQNENVRLLKENAALKAKLERIASAAAA